MERFEVPNYDGPGNYLVRLRLIQTPLFGIYFHRFDAPDPRPTLHDHPWNFVSIVLRGGYEERRLDPVTLKVEEHHAVRRFNLLRANDAHSITRLFRKPTWTLLLVGRRRREWGYLEPSPIRKRRWVWTAFDSHFHAAEFEAALARRQVAADQ